MDKTALRHAWECLHDARAGAGEIERAITFADTERGWRRFLHAAASFFNKLEAGSKGYGAVEGWFGRVKHVRKTDPLLRYVHHARNSAEHGIKDITKRAGAETSIRGGNLFFPNLIITHEGITGNIVNLTPEVPVVVENLPARMVLTTVTDRGEDYPVPAEHQGKKLDPEPSPQALAELCCAYMESVVRECSAMAKAHDT